MSDVKALEFQKTQFKEQVRLRECLARLVNNSDFQTLILDEYFVKEAASLARQAGDPNSLPLDRDMAMQQAMAPGHFKRWLVMTEQFGDKAQDNLELIEAELIEARREDLEER